MPDGDEPGLPVPEALHRVFGDLRGAVGAVSEVLDAYREPQAEGTRDLGWRLEEATERYAGATEGCLEVLRARLDGEERAVGVVVDQLLAVASVDATIAVQAGLLAALREPVDPRPEAPTGPLDDDERGALGPRLVEQVEPLLAELDGDDGSQHDAPGAEGNGPPSPPGSPALPAELKSRVDELFDRVLTTAAGDLVATGAHCVPFGAGLVSQLVRLDFPDLTGLLDTLQAGFHALRRLFVRALGWIAGKLHAIFDTCLPGDGGLSSVLEAVGSWLDGHVGDWVAAALDGALQVAKPRSEARACLARDPDPRAALRAAGKVVEHFERRRRLVPLANRALALTTGLNLAGVPVTPAVGALLVAYSVLNAHDHTDSPVLGVHIPGNTGLRQALCEANPGVPGARVAP